MSLVNYVLIGLLGTILAIALYSARMDMSLGGALAPAAMAASV